MHVHADTDQSIEREEGNDYEQGWKTYGFAAPFSSTEATAKLA